jgi:hypothetical protein
MLGSMNCGAQSAAAAGRRARRARKARRVLGIYNNIISLR